VTWTALPRVHPDLRVRSQRFAALRARTEALRPGTRCVCARDHRVARRKLSMYGKRWETILANESGPEAGVEGVAEDVKGRAKEAAGAVSGNESLKQEGQAQQDKAAAQRDVAAKEAEAEKARAQASAAEAEQRSHQQNP
jgi:uncharacterized protein YjbJ (UPF0337 family)